MHHLWGNESTVCIALCLPPSLLPDPHSPRCEFGNSADLAYREAGRLQGPLRDKAAFNHGQIFKPQRNIEA